MSVVAIIGSGLIGRAWALVFARAGWQVKMYDISAELLAGLPEKLHQESQILVRHKLAEDANALVKTITFTHDLAEALNGADFVQENGPERLDAKLDIFATLDRLTPQDVPIASSTSSIVASLFSEQLAGRGRVLVGHPVNPPHLVPLVEVCGASWTKEAVLKKAYDIYASIGQVPVRVHKEIDGFVLNRLQGALLAEALKLVGEGIISVEDLDKTVKDGLGLRWAFMGPFETIELNAAAGAEDYFSRYGPVFAKMAKTPAGADVFDKGWTQKIVKNWNGRLPESDIVGRSSWRNERLAALTYHKSEQDKN
ncbi:MAG: 3-hydroxyacyl-CoA dehydrogenase [Alphaproteobacteria bacterium]|nr:3-hydroxyacyl-CoA dehydrogenase [Alphaproteobacteria bacterium]